MKIEHALKQLDLAVASLDGRNLWGAAKQTRFESKIVPEFRELLAWEKFTEADRQRILDRLAHHRNELHAAR